MQRSTTFYILSRATITFLIFCFLLVLSFVPDDSICFWVFLKSFAKWKNNSPFFFFKSFTLELLFWIKNSASLNDEVRLKSEFLFESISRTIKNNFDSFNGYSSPPNLDLSIILVHFCKFSFCFLNLSKLASSTS